MSKKAEKLEAALAMVEACIEADIRRQQDRIEKKAIRLKMKLKGDKPKTEEKK